MTIAVDSEARVNKMHKIEIFYKNGHYGEYVIDEDIEELERALLRPNIAITIRTPKGFVYLGIEEIVSLEVTEIEENNE